MAEYWKSTPTYWCKHCKIYVRDTKFEKQNHEATGRHQGNLKRFVKELHRENENEAREKLRAKSEIARLNGIVSGTSSMPGPSTIPPPSVRPPRPAPPKRAAPKPPANPEAVAAQRKAQLAQLVQLGVNIPDEFRAQMAMAGEWTVSEPPSIDEVQEKGKGVDSGSLGVHKRVTADDEDDEEPDPKKRKWGSTYKAYPGQDAEDGDLEALLMQPLSKVKAEGKAKQEVGAEDQVFVKPEPSEQDDSLVKAESDNENAALEQATDTKPEPAPARDDTESGTVTFKKRKAKNIRQK